MGGQSAVEIGNNSNLQMHIYVTNGTFWLDKKSNITETTIGKWVVIENISVFFIYPLSHGYGKKFSANTTGWTVRFKM